jgi:hypothetical protein
MTLKERLHLLDILPGQGTFEDMVCVSDIRKKLEVTQEEIVLFDIHTVPGAKTITWSEEKLGDKTWEFEFTELEKNLLKKTLKKMSDEGRFSFELLDLYRTFVQP